MKKHALFHIQEELELEKQKQDEKQSSFGEYAARDMATSPLRFDLIAWFVM